MFQVGSLHGSTGGGGGGKEKKKNKNLVYRLLGLLIEVSFVRTFSLQLGCGYWTTGLGLETYILVLVPAY